MQRFFGSLFLLVVLLLQAGCASIVSYSLYGDGCTDLKYGCGPEDEDKRVRYYRGTYMSAQAINADAPRTFDAGVYAWKAALVVDLPFTLVADTVVAPFIAVKKLLADEVVFPGEAGYLELGSQIRTEDVTPDDRWQMRTGPSQQRPFIMARVNGVIYRIAYDRETREIRYVYTRDRAFAAGNLRVGSPLLVKRSELVDRPHWYVTGPPTHEGWIPIFGHSGGADMIRVMDDGKDRYMALGRGPKHDDGADPLTLRVMGFYRSAEYWNDALLRSCPIRAGDSVETVRKHFQITAEPVAATGSDYYLYRFQEYGIYVFFDREKKVTRLTFAAPFAGKIGGVSIGDTKEKVVSLKGQPEEPFSRMPDIDLAGKKGSSLPEQTEAWRYKSSERKFLRYEFGTQSGRVESIFSDVGTTDP